MTPKPQPKSLVDALVDNLRGIERLLSIAREVQWEKSPAPPAARDDTSERGQGGPVPNPTFETVADEPRLQVRAEVRRAEAFLRWVEKMSQVVRTGLDSAISTWEGRP